MEEADWPNLCSARPEFVSLSEADVRIVLATDSEGKHPVTKEVMRLAAEFLAAFKIYVDQNGFKPHGIDLPVRCPIEKVAIETIVRFIEAQAGSVRAAKRK